MNTLQDAVNHAVQLHRAGRLSEAAALYQRILQVQPQWAEGYAQLAAVLFASNQLPAAAETLQRAIANHPANPAQCHSNLGAIFSKLGQLENAATAHRLAIAIDPAYATGHCNLGNVLRRLKQFESAEQSYRAAIVLDPKMIDACNGLGLTFFDRGRYSQAIEQFQIALQIDATDVNASLNAVLCLGRLGDRHAAEKILRDANLTVPEQSSTLLMLLNYQHAGDPAYMLCQSLDYNARHIAPLATMHRPHTNSRNPNRRLRIGYISPDFRQHSVAYFLLPVLENHDRSAFFIACYAEVEAPDNITTKFLQHADLWRSTVGQSHDAVAEQIGADGIDILIDLAGHTLDNRLQVLGLQPAPIQITWLGYPGTTGVSTVAFRLTDGIADPPGADDFYTEKLIRLDAGLSVYQPPANSPAIQTAPILQNGFITFGSFNDLMKVSSETIELWAQLLTQLPQGRLVLKALQFGSEAGKHLLLDQFNQRGIGADRIELLNWSADLNSHLKLYNKIDIALDTFPYNGTTTTCEALWMGVPVVSLAGATAVSRMGASILSRVGLAGDWLVSEKTEYLRIASHWASMPTRLDELRQTLRQRVSQSSLADANAFTRDLELNLQRLWKNWCQTEITPKG